MGLEVLLARLAKRSDGFVTDSGLLLLFGMTIAAAVCFFMLIPSESALSAFGVRFVRDEMRISLVSSQVIGLYVDFLIFIFETAFHPLNIHHKRLSLRVARSSIAFTC